MAEVTPEQLHKFAVDAEQNVEKLATGLAQVGAPEPTVKTVSQIADALRTIAKSLASAAQAAPAPEPTPGPEPRHTMASATNDMMAEAKAQRGGQ